MDEATLNSRLTRISTVWTLLDEAGGGLSQARHSAQIALIRRYQGAVYRYLLGATRDPDKADELFQDFALRVIAGRYCHADPERGRFRDYLKTSLFRMVIDYQKRERRAPQTAEPGKIDPTVWERQSDLSEKCFLNSWREELLSRTWEALRKLECEDGQPYFSVLRFRAENPKIPSAEMANILTQQLCREPPFTSMSVRKTLQRAREQFANLLTREVALSMKDPTKEELEQELIDLQLHTFCRPVLSRRRG